MTLPTTSYLLPRMVVQVRAWPEIAVTLGRARDAGRPALMPEMLKFCGRTRADQAQLARLEPDENVS